MPSKKSLHGIYGNSLEVLALWIAAAITLLAGLCLPVIAFTELMVRKSSYSIISGAIELTQHGDYVLAIVIVLFSVVLPMVKLGGLAYLWFATIKTTDRKFFLTILGSLGKWSMLDVYVVALTVVIAKSSIFVKAEPQTGIYLFGLAVVLSIVLSLRMEHLSKHALKSIAES